MKEQPGLTSNRTSITQLEKELHSQLDIARVPGRIDFAITRVVLIPTAASTEGQTAVGIGITVAAGADAQPLRVVEGIEGFQPELEGGVLALGPRKLEVLEEGEVPVVAAGTGQGVATHVSEHAGLTVGGEL